jgi:hypothetical protein
VEKAVEEHGNLIQKGVAKELLKNYVLNQYQNYELLEHYLHRPIFLVSQWLFPLSRRTRLFLIERWVVWVVGGPVLMIRFVVITVWMNAL